jgi:hypothetical protein
MASAWSKVIMFKEPQQLVGLVVEVFLLEAFVYYLRNLLNRRLGQKE